MRPVITAMVFTVLWGLCGSAVAEYAAKDRRQAYRVDGYTCDDIRAGIALMGGYEAALAYLKTRDEKVDARKIKEAVRICHIQR